MPCANYAKYDYSTSSHRQVNVRKQLLMSRILQRCTSKFICTIIAFAFCMIIWRQWTLNNELAFQLTKYPQALGVYSSNNNGRPVRIFCWIMTIAEHHDSHARHVKATWASHCDDYLFISSATNASLPAVDVNVSDGRAYLWTKTRAAFRHIYKWELSQYDWFLKADDDTYVIVENLRYMLRNYSYQQPIFFGCKFRKFIPEGTMSGGAGYVLSREAVRRLVDEALTPAHADRCIDGDGTGVEDLEISKCLAAVGVIAGDSRDHTGKHRMLPFNMQRVVIPEASETEQAAKVNNSRNQPDWWYEYTYYPFEQGMNCCSDTPISFHYVKWEEMYVLEYFLYHTRVVRNGEL